MLKGQRITGKKVSKETYVPLFDFLLFDSNFRKLSPNAKVLYSYLRNKMNFFQKQTEQFYEGLEGTRSYEDKEGNIFCIADNSELEYMLVITEPTLIKLKKELETFKLLEQVKIKDKPNHLYILEPIKVDEEWVYIEEIKKIRNDRKIKNQEKKEKRNNKKSEQIIIEKEGEEQNIQEQKEQNKEIPKNHINNPEIESMELLQENLPKQTGQILKTYTSTYEEMYGLYGVVLRAKKKAESYFNEEKIIWLEESNEFDIVTANVLKKCFQRKKLGELGKKTIIENFENYVFSSLEETFYNLRQEILNELIE